MTSCVISIRHAFWLLQFNLTFKTNSRKKKQNAKSKSTNCSKHMLGSRITTKSLYFKVREHAISWALQQTWFCQALDSLLIYISTDHRPSFKNSWLKRTHSRGLVGDVAAASQTWVKVGDTIRATDRRILMNPAPTVDVTASRQVSVRQSQRRPAKTSFSAAHVSRWYLYTGLHGFTPLPGGVRDIDSTEVDALTADNKESGKAEQRHAAADHGQLCCFSCT